MDDKLDYTFTDIKTLNGRYISCLFNKKKAVQPTPKRASNLHLSGRSNKNDHFTQKNQITLSATVRLEGTEELLGF